MNNNDVKKSYVNGFVLSLLLTFASYFIVVDKIFTGTTLTFAILLLALGQLTIQLVFFLHILQESKPRWNLAIVLATISVLVVIVVSSILIINNLNYRHLTPENPTDYIFKEEGLSK